MRYVCVFKILGCVCACVCMCLRVFAWLSLLCWSSFWLLLNKQAFPSFVWAVGSFADHLTPALTCFSTCSLSATSVEENHYRWGLSLSSSSSSSSGHHSRRKVLLPSSMLSSSTPPLPLRGCELKPTDTTHPFERTNCSFDLWGKERNYTSKFFLAASVLQKETELDTTPSTSVAAKKGNVQTISLLQKISVGHFKPSIQKVCIISCPDEPRHIV